MAEELKEEPIFIESIPQYQEFLRVNNMDNTPWRYSVYTIARLPLRKKIYELEQKLAESEKKIKSFDAYVWRDEKLKESLELLRESLPIMQKNYLRTKWFDRVERLHER